MKIVPSALAPGDSVEISVTHEIKIDGDKSWVGVRMTTTVKPTETQEDAVARLDEAVQTAVMSEVQSTVKRVMTK